MHNAENTASKSQLVQSRRKETHQNFNVGIAAEDLVTCDLLAKSRSG